MREDYFLVALAFNKQSDLSAHFSCACGFVCLWTGNDTIKDYHGDVP